MTQAQSGVLERAELQRLTDWKWRYSLEAKGFDKETAQRLAFLTWLYVSGRLEP